MKNPTTIFDGFAYVSDNGIVPFHFENGIFDFLGGNIINHRAKTGEISWREYFLSLPVKS
ncbi:hypothetical protein AGMMS49975_16080 [Clostridia bacterium]|nr:hypothetical protein AGMMS49975_16080 [Clostridia bacterium]